MVLCVAKCDRLETMDIRAGVSGGNWSVSRSVYMSKRRRCFCTARSFCFFWLPQDLNSWPTHVQDFSSAKDVILI